MKVKYGRDIVVGDTLFIASGSTVPFHAPVQPANVLEKWPFPFNSGQSKLITQKYPGAPPEEYIVWNGERYVVMEKES